MDHPQLLLTRGRMPRGMTLIEAVMSMAILSVILLIASQMSMSMSEITAEETAETQVQTDLRRAMSELVFLLEESRPVALWREDQIAAELPFLPKAPDGTYNYNQNEDLRDRGLCFTFTVPIKQVSGQLRRKPTANGLDAGQAYYGAGDGGAALESEYINTLAGFKTNTYTVFFLPTGEVIKESVEGLDLDSNGVTTDEFIYGGLYICQDNTGQVRQITGRIAIKKFIGLKALYPTVADEFPAGRFDDRRGKCFFLEYELFEDGNSNGIYDASQSDKFDHGSDGNDNLQWDVKMIIKFYFLVVRNDPRRGKVSRMRVVETRINYFRNSYKVNAQ